MLMIECFATTDDPPAERLELPFDLRCKSRLRTRLASGEECGLLLERGVVLRGGDRLALSDGRIVEVVSASEALLEVASADPLQLARAAYHLGNRHVAVELRPGCLRFAADHVLADMLRGLGLKVAALEAPFEPEQGAYGAHGSHHHGADHHHPSGPRLHDHGAGT